MALVRLSKWCRSLREPSKSIFCGILQSDWSKNSLQVNRHLLSDDMIKLNDFQQRKWMAHLSAKEEAHFIQLFNKKLQRKEEMENRIKNLFHRCRTPDDMVVFRDAIYRYHSEIPNGFNKVRFGPRFMRLCLELSMVEMAADTALKGFFDDHVSFNMALGLLFHKGDYETALEVLKTMKIHRVQFNRGTIKLALGTCYKLNTPESYEMCTTLIEEIQIWTKLTSDDAYCLATALALAQNDSAMAQHLCSKIVGQKTGLCYNLKVLTFAMSGNFEAVLSILYYPVRKNPAFLKNCEFAHDVVDVVRSKCEGSPYTAVINGALSRLEEVGLVSELTLDDLLCQITDRKPPRTDAPKRTKARFLPRIQDLLTSLAEEHGKEMPQKEPSQLEVALKQTIQKPAPSPMEHFFMSLLPSIQSLTLYEQELLKAEYHRILVEKLGKVAADKS